MCIQYSACTRVRTYTYNICTSLSFDFAFWVTTRYTASTTLSLLYSILLNIHINMYMYMHTHTHHITHAHKHIRVQSIHIGAHTYRCATITQRLLLIARCLPFAQFCTQLLVISTICMAQSYKLWIMKHALPDEYKINTERYCYINGCKRCMDRKLKIP